MAARSGRAHALSVVVPVHDEAAGIARAAAALLDGLPEEAELVFACNGCSDGSAALLRGVVGTRALVLELAEANKAMAIAEAERHVSAFPRFYVDSDVEISGFAIARLAAVLRQRDLDLVSPLPEFDLSGASWAARSVASVWRALPHGGAAGFHAVLGVSARGRSGWIEMPDIAADDAFIESRIDPARKAVVPDVRFVARPPRTLRSFIRVRERWLRGHRQLAAMGIGVDSTPGQRRALLALALRPDWTLPVLLYVLARLVAHLRAVLAPSAGWYRDSTTRVPARRVSKDG